MSEKHFYFTVELYGCGETAEDAWEYALENFVQDPGSPPGIPDTRVENEEGEDLPIYYGCDQCDGFHRVGPIGPQCRDHRYSTAWLDKTHGPDGWAEVPKE